MQTKKNLGTLYALALVVFGMIGSASATSANTDVSDIWWNPAESGWGMQMVNTGTFVFATVYVYGSDGKPTWLVGQLAKTGAARTTYTGPTYVTTGPYFDGAFDPNAVTAREAGSMTFVLDTVTTGGLTYSVDGVVVIKSVQRQPLTLDNYNGDYVAYLTQTIAGCNNPINNRTLTDTRALRITQNGSAVVVVTTANNGLVCTINGAFTQLGRMGQVQGAYACNSGEVGTAILFEMNNVPFMLTARLQSQSSNFGCAAAGELAGVIPR
jgi:hypothetical protein